MKWSSSQHVQGIDSFGWVEEQLRNAPGRQLFGIMRVPSADVGNLLGVSGQRGIFVEPAKRDLHRFRSEWIPRLSKQESHDHYMQRALRGAPAMGLAVFGQRIAWRHNLKEGEVLPRVWTIDGLPSTVTAQDMLPVLEQGFQEVTLMSHRRKKGLLSVRFRAVCTAGDRDLVPLRVSIDQGDPVCFWATLAPARSVEAKQKPLGKKAVPFVSAAQQTSLDPKPNPAAGAEAQQVDDEGKPIPNAKRTRGATREIPTGLQREECPKDGNCAFTSMAAALNWIQQKSGDDAYNHLELRARVATHIAKHSDQYKSEWDQKLPDGSMGKTWDDYLQATAQAGSFASELELRAIGRVFDVRILILPASDCFQPMVFHTSQKKRLAVLWLQDKHLEFLKPSCEKSSCKDYPAEFWQVTDGPVRGIRAGGKTVSARASAAGSVGTVFTCDAASRAGTVWTKAPKTNPKEVASDRGSLKVESAVTRPDGARRNRGPRSRGAAACSQTAASRSTNASVFTGKRSAQGDCISKQCTLAEGSGAGVLGDADDDSQDLSGCEPEAPRSKRLAPCSHRAPVLRPADGIFKCSLCPFHRATATLAQYRQVNTNHYKRHHAGATLPGKLLRPRVGKVAGGAKNRFWKRPKCSLGVSQEVRASITRHVFSAMCEEHRLLHHPEVPKPEWTKLMKQNHPGLKDPKGFAAGCRARQLQKVALAEVKQARFPGMQTFVWPVPVFFASPGNKKKGDCKRKIRRISLQHAWKCLKCGEISQVLRAARRHSKGPCPPRARVEATRKRRQDKIEIMQVWVRDQVASPSERQLLNEALNGASVAIQSSPLASSSSVH